MSVEKMPRAGDVRSQAPTTTNILSSGNLSSFLIKSVAARKRSYGIQQQRCYLEDGKCLFGGIRGEAEHHRL